MVRAGEAGMRHSNAKWLTPWRSSVAAAAALAMDEREALIGPVRLELAFRVQRPHGHYGTGRNADKLRPSAPAVPITNPDLDKLVRAVLDALTGIVYRDDAQVVELEVVKRYGPPGLDAWVMTWT